MRVTLQDATLARYAGRFVWLELNFDGAPNRDFLSRFGVASTPSFFIIDPSDQHATATQLGAMTVAELSGFLDRGERVMRAKSRTPADGELARGDALLASDHHGEAAAAYENAVRDGGPGWAEHNRAVASLTWALMSSHQWQRCSEVAADNAASMRTSSSFGRVLVAGMTCVNHDETSSWATAAAKTLEPLSADAIASPLTVRDHRFQLYQLLMDNARQRGDTAAMQSWGDRWLKELDGTKPVNDDERSALDIARVDAASILDAPGRVLPQLQASERVMPTNYNASLRLAQMQVAARQYEQAVAACDRGLQHVTGAVGRSWLLQVKADALTGMHRRAQAETVLRQALEAAHGIPTRQTRANNEKRISDAIKALREGEKSGGS